VSGHPLELTYSNVWGPALESVGRYKYYISFTDDYSKFTWIYLLKFKSEVIQKFHEFQSLVDFLPHLLPGGGLLVGFTDGDIMAMVWGDFILVAGRLPPDGLVQTR
jgi:hypothetical protein